MEKIIIDYGNSVAAGAKETVTAWGITYMQEMNSAICTSRAEVGEAGQLMDSRDGKIYWVAKLADGNCWMTQNLDLDLTTAGLSKNDTNIAEDWNSNSAYPPVATQTGSPSGFSGTNALKSYDPGYKYCNESGCDLTSSTNGGHDAQGNYYTWMAATAGTGADLSTDGTSASSSICPKGWQLPLSGTKNNENSKSFYYLLNGLTNAQIIAAPYYFVYGGSVNNSTLNNAGSYGLYWSATANSIGRAYLLSFSSGSVSPSGFDNRAYGSSVRCVAR